MSALSPEEKQRIYEEEKARLEATPESNNIGADNSWSRIVVILILGVVTVWVFWWALTPPESNISPEFNAKSRAANDAIDRVITAQGVVRQFALLEAERAVDELSAMATNEFEGNAATVVFNRLLDLKYPDVSK